jgi:hypothetical protein
MTEDTDIEENLEEEEAVADDEAEPTAADLDDVAAATEPAPAADVESIQEILQKQEDSDADDDVAEEDDAVLATITKDEKLEPIDTRVVPIQETEFTCKRCFLVKHRSQLADKKRVLCRDCA